MPEQYFALELKTALSQGDIIENVRIAEPQVGAAERTFSVMVLSHDCEIDKPSNKVMLVARLRELQEYSPAHFDAIREGKLLALFYLPPDLPAFASEHCVDLRMTYRVPFDAVGATAFVRGGDDDRRVFPGADPRKCSLSEFGLAALYGRIVGFYTRTLDFGTDEDDTAP